MIPFNKPYISGKEKEYIGQAIDSGVLTGEGNFSKRCREWMEETYRFQKVLLTTSATVALEMAALLIDIQPGDEVIIPSFTFVSTANAFALRGAKIIFADSLASGPNIDAENAEQLITFRTKAVVVIHYAGIACDVEKLRRLADAKNIYLIEDASQAVHAFCNDKPLGSFGHLAAFSFHATKNLTSGEGGMLIVNDKNMQERAEVIADKGTNRTAFLRGEVGAYNWVDIGSSCAPSEIAAAFLAAQLEQTYHVSERRLKLWEVYSSSLRELGDKIGLPHVPSFAKHNGHTFYLVCNNEDERNGLIAALKQQDIQAAFHYQSLHKSPYYSGKHTGPELTNANKYSAQLVRLPLYYDLRESEAEHVSEAVIKFYKNR